MFSDSFHFTILSLLVYYLPSPLCHLLLQRRYRGGWMSELQNEKLSLPYMHHNATNRHTQHTVCTC